MQERAAQLCPHPLAEAQLPERGPKEPAKVEGFRELAEPFFVIVFRDPVDVPEQAVAVEDRDVPPELHPLAEDHANAADVAFPVFPRDLAVHQRLAAVRRENAGEDLDRRGFAGAVRADIADQLALPDVEGNALQGFLDLLLPKKCALFALFPHYKVFLKVLHMDKAHFGITPFRSRWCL